MSQTLETGTEPNKIYDDLFGYANQLGYGEIHFKIDRSTGLFAIIAVHSTKLGPAIGGCRCVGYDTVFDAIKDALRLAQMMTYKASVSGLPHGGGKAVLIKPQKIENRAAYFEAFGDFINELNGRYITAVDSGTSTEDMDYIARKTRYVTCTQNHYMKDGDPSYFTARGVRRGIEAAVKFKLGKSSLNGVHVAVQGAGHVGQNLVRELHELGARITVSDVDATAVARCVDDFNAESVPPEEIYSLPCDVLSPCALGAILNQENIDKIQAPIVAGAANNQLETPLDGETLHQHSILYAPDFVINSGGLIRVATMYDHEKPEIAIEQIYRINDKLMNIFDRSVKENIPASQIAEKMALENLK